MIILCTFGYIRLTFSNKDNSIISYDLIDYKKINEIKKAHKSLITSFRYIYDNLEYRDLIISISNKDSNIKLWNINNYFYNYIIYVFKIKNMIILNAY